MKDRRSELRGRSPLMSYKRQPMNSCRSSGRRSASMERRRSDHAKEFVHNNSPLPQLRYRSSSPLPSDDGFIFQRNYILPDQPSFNPTWKTSQSSLDVEENGARRQNPTFIGEQSSRTRVFYSDHRPIGASGGSNFGMGIREVEMHSYNDGLRDQYDDMEMDRRHLHYKDMSIPRLPYSSQLRPFSSNSSSSILKEDVKGLRRSPISDGLATGIGRYPNPNDPLEHYAYNQVAKPDLHNDLRIYDYDEFQARHGVQDEPYKKRACVSRAEFRNPASSSILDHSGDWMDKDGSINRNMIQRTFSERHHHLHEDVVHDYDDVIARQEVPTYSGNWHGGLRIKSSRDYENMPFEEGCASEKEFYPISHRAENRSRKSLLSDHDLDEHKLSVSAHDRSHMDGLGDYDIERMERRNYGIIKDMDVNDSRLVFMNDQHLFAPYESKEMWPAEERLEPSLSKSRLMEHSRFRKNSRDFSTSDAFMLSSGASSMHAKSDLNSNLKRRLKYNSSDFHTPYFSEQKQGLLRSHNYWKRGMHDRLGTQGRGTHDSVAHVVKNDPPEDSEEFKQQVHKAFLRYSKLLNESQHNQRIYQTQGNNYSLLCSVCGSNSKEFIGTNSLVTHSYHSLKAGLKTEHLGFHKALCVLMGWNWRIPPENSRAYQSMPVADAKAMREDLILWPPFVIIHNILTGDKSSTKDAKVTVESLEKILRDMGFGAGKIIVRLGKPANQSIFTVKFMPTFSGFQTAERLHKHFADKKHGRLEFQQISSRGKNGVGKKQSEQQVDEFLLLYGYMAVAEDLDKLDPANKKRSLLKSKKDDIEAIADAPLNIV